MYDLWEAQKKYPICLSSFHVNGIQFSKIFSCSEKVLFRPRNLGVIGG